MAINPETQYPGKINPSNAEYPYGSARNITVPGDGTGTPWEAALVNDIFGFQQSLLSAAGIVPSGNPDTVQDSEYQAAVDALYSRTFDTETELAAASSEVGVVVRTRGKSTAGDGQGNDFLVVSPQAPGPNDVTLADGNIAVWLLRPATQSSFDNTGTGTAAADVQGALAETARSLNILLPPYLNGVRSGSQGRPYPREVPDAASAIVAIALVDIAGDERWLIRTKFSGWRQGDYAEYEVWNQGQTMSPKMEYCWAINGMRLYRHGKLYNFSDMTGLVPSTVEFAMNAGLMADTPITDPALWDRYGPGHGFMTYVAAQIFLNGTVPDETGAAEGTVLRGTSISFQSQAEVILPKDFKTTSAITGVSQANPAVVTSTGHGLTTGNEVYLFNVQGMTELNNNFYTITVIDANSFSLDGVDSTLFSAYVSGGIVALVTRIGTVDWQHVFGSTGLRVLHQHERTVAGTGTQNSYMGMGTFTHIDTVDPVNGPSITVGFEDDSQVGNWAAPDTGTQLRHFFAYDSPVYLEMNLAQGNVGTPPSDWSYAASSRRFVRDLPGGVRKSYFNWCSGSVGIPLAQFSTHSHLMDYKFYAP